MHFPLASVRPHERHDALAELSLQTCHLEALDAEMVAVTSEVERVKATLGRVIRVHLAEARILRREVDRRLWDMEVRFEGLEKEG
jgi:hypothetical protein